MSEEERPTREELLAMLNRLVATPQLRLRTFMWTYVIIAGLGTTAVFFGPAIASWFKETESGRALCWLIAGVLTGLVPLALNTFLGARAEKDEA